MTPATRQLAAITAWGLAQFILLVIGASGYSLWSHHPIPHESLSLSILLCGQMIFISLWMPGLSADSATLAKCLLLMVPMDELAGLLAHASQMSILFGFAAISLWMAGLRNWGVVLKDSERGRLMLAMMGSLWTLGGSLLDYLRWEASLASGSTPFEAIAPLARLMRANWADSGFFWLTMGVPLIAAILCRACGFSAHSPGRNASSTSLHTDI